MRTNRRNIILGSCIWLVLSTFNIHAQYFGRNKPGYTTFEFKVLQSPSFEIYHYQENDSLIRCFSERAEKWYVRHQHIFKDTIDEKNPILLYDNHADFQQTNAIGSLIGAGTGGVTESLKNRVIMPFAPTNAQTDHVLGHELVHAFQYNTLFSADTSKDYSIQNIPLWLVEGMAEYLSIGSIDPNTAMWMRDAVINDDFPTIRDLSKSTKYFPYRYGHSFWAMVGKTFGDTLIMPLFEKSAQYGVKRAIDSVFGIDEETLSGMWKSATEVFYKNVLPDTVVHIYGNKIITKDNGGRLNLAPSLSPDGKFLAFFSEKDVFTLDLYLANAQTGKIIKKLSSVTRSRDIDDFSSLESGGTWSPDSRKFAFTVFSKGQNKLVIADVDKGRIAEEIAIPGINSFSGPSWSPDGASIVLSAMLNGESSLFLYNFKSKDTTRLTQPGFSAVHPSWSPDGSFIAFVKESENHTPGTGSYQFNIALLDVHNLDIRELELLNGAKNLNPIFSYDGKYIFFLSDADGFRNLFSYDLHADKLYRLTEYPTGISGITPFAPAVTAARDQDFIAYILYYNHNYEVVTARLEDFKPALYKKDSVDFTAGTLPPLNHLTKYNMVDSALYYSTETVIDIPDDSLNTLPYRPKFQLDYISNSGGVGISSGRYSSGNMSGSVSMLFSDIIGNNQLYSSFSLNGEIYDFGGAVSFVNQAHRFKWGTSLSHIPYRYGEMSVAKDTIQIEDEPFLVNKLILDYIRMFEDNISLFGYYPINQTRRFEAGASASWYYYRFDRYNHFYNDFGYFLGESREKLDAPEGGNYQRLNLAYVEDNSFSGMTSPMRGHRSRFQIEKYFGHVDYYTALADYRKYFFMNPVSLAFRFIHYGRYGSDSETSLVSPIYIGYPWLIRGYENVSFYNEGNAGMVSQGQDAFNVSNLSGSRIAIANAEIRLPVSGPEILALIKSKWFLIDFNLFFDAGLAWNQGDKINLEWTPETFTNRVPVFSAGTSFRINLFGYLVIEPYYAFPFQNGGWSNGVFGLNFTPGW